MANPVSGALTIWLVVPDPADCCEVAETVARLGSGPYSNHAFVGSPFGVTLAFSVAPVLEIEDAATVVATGGVFGEAVVNWVAAVLTHPRSFLA